MAREVRTFADNLPLESARSRGTREFVDGDTKVSAFTGDSAAAFFPTRDEKTPVSSLYRADGTPGAVQGTNDGVGGVADARQGTEAASVPDRVATTQDLGADGRLNIDTADADTLPDDTDDRNPSV